MVGQPMPVLPNWKCDDWELMMAGPITGSVRAKVLAVEHTSIHGDVYVDLLIQTTDQNTNNEASRVRAPVHACAGMRPQVGLVVTIEFLMGQVTRIVSSQA